MAKKLEGKVAVITGGNSGMGLATAKLFAEEGAYVYVTGRRQKELDEAAKEIGKNVIAVQGDVANLADLDKLYDAVKQKHGRVDVVFANAGAGELVPLGEITEQHFDKLFDINVKGLLFTVQKALPLMPDGGSIILNGSIAGYTGTPAFSVYSATKAAVRSFARSWTNDLKARKIRVNTLSPGPIDTPILDGLGKTKDDVGEGEGRVRRPDPTGPHGQAGRDRHGGPVPRVRRQQFRDRHRPVRGRRRGPGVTAGVRWQRSPWTRAARATRRDGWVTRPAVPILTAPRR